MLVSINIVALHWARLLLGWVTVCLLAGKPSRCVLSHLNAAFHRSVVGKSSTDLSGWG